MISPKNDVVCIKAQNLAYFEKITIYDNPTFFGAEEVCFCCLFLMIFCFLIELNPQNLFLYCKLVETFHIVCECNTAIYFSWCLIQALAQPAQLFWQLVTFSVASGNSLTDSDLQLFIETEQDRTRHTFIQYLLKSSLSFLQ